MGDLSDAQQQLFDAMRASSLELHQKTLARLTALDKARSVQYQGREATAEELATATADREAEWPYELLRFLRAQKWDLAKTQQSYADYLAWREREKIDSILDRVPWNAELIDRCVGNNAANEDKQGNCVYIEKSGACDVDLMLGLFTDEDIVRSHLWQQENSVRRAAELSKKHGRHIETFTQIVDLHGLGMAHKRALKYTKDFFALDAAYYPERLGQLFVVNAPWVFPVIWNIVKGWIDPVTRNKIHVIKGDPSAFLLTHFAPEMLPKEYGGTCNTCPNSPECCKQYPVAAALELLVYQPGDVQLTAEKIKAGKDITATHEVAAGEVVEWAWRLPVKDEDVDFTVTFTPADAAKKEQPPVQVVQSCRIMSAVGVLPEGVGEGGVLSQASFEAPEAGTVSVVWDNKFSWLASKHLEYWTRKSNEPRKEATSARAAARNGAASSSSSSSSAPAK